MAAIVARLRIAAVGVLGEEREVDDRAVVDEARARDMATHEPGIRAQSRRRMNPDLGGQRLLQKPRLAALGSIAGLGLLAVVRIQRLDGVTACQSLPVGIRQGLVGE